MLEPLVSVARDTIRRGRPVSSLRWLRGESEEGFGCALTPPPAPRLSRSPSADSAFPTTNGFRGPGTREAVRVPAHSSERVAPRMITPLTALSRVQRSLGVSCKRGRSSGQLGIDSRFYRAGKRRGGRAGGQGVGRPPLTAERGS